MGSSGGQHKDTVGKAAKPTLGQLEERVREVYTLLLSNLNRSGIQEHCRKKWGIQRAAVDNLISKANAIIRADLEASKDSILISLLEKQNRLYEKIIEDRPISKEGQGLPNYGAARQVLMDIAKLTGLETTKVSVSVADHDEETKELSESDLDQILGDD